MDRREFLKTVAVSATGAFLAKNLSKTLMAYFGEPAHAPVARNVSTMYMTRNIPPESLAAAYAALGREVKEKVARWAVSTEH